MLNEYIGRERQLSGPPTTLLLDPGNPQTTDEGFDNAVQADNTSAFFTGKDVRDLELSDPARTAFEALVKERVATGRARILRVPGLFDGDTKAPEQD